MLNSAAASGRRSVAEGVEPVVGGLSVGSGDGDAGEFEGALALALAALEGPHVVPEDEQVEPVLGTAAVVEVSTLGEELAQDAVEALHG